MRIIAIKNSLKFLLSLKFYIKRNTAIICYHCFGNKENPAIRGQEINIHPDLFDLQCKFFKKYYNIISVNDLLERKNDKHLKRGNLIITCDDGFKSSFTIGYQIATKYGIPIHIFVNTAFIGNKNALWRSVIHYILNMGGRGKFVERLAESYGNNDLKQKLFAYEGIISWTRENYQRERMEMAIHMTLEDMNTSEGEISKKYKMFCSEEDIRDSKNIISIGCHSHTHANMAKLSKREQYEEMYKSKMILEEVYGKKINTFAVPFGGEGNYNKETIKTALDIGFKGIFTAQGNLAFFHKENMIFDRIFAPNNVKDLPWLLSRPALRKKLI